ncbi:MAG: diaminopimelate decarboxylase [Acetanaerobacterium sp.]
MKTPFLSCEKLKKITAQYPTPFHIYDEAGIRKTARDLYKAFSWNKGFKEYFAVKATPNPAIMKILREEGCGVDCSSLTELMLSDAVGFAGDEIMFSSNVTPREDYALAAKLDAIINLDDITHIEYLEGIAGIPETISLRYNPGGDFSLGNEIMDTPSEAKYGLTRLQMTAAINKLMMKGARHFGMHAFLASNMVENAYYPQLARIMFETAAELQRETGAHFSFINLSGGVGVAYHPGQPQSDIFAIGEGVKEAFEDVLVPAGMGDVRIFTELGRFMLAPHGALIATAIHEKHIYKEYIGLDACAANLMRPAMYGAYHHITVMGKEDAPCDYKYDITGGLCENNDKFAVDRMLPKIDIGDLIYLHDTGAHGFSMGYNYNGKLRSAEVLLKEDGSTELIRRAETPADYFATFDFMDLFEGEAAGKKGFVYEDGHPAVRNSTTK